MFCNCSYHVLTASHRSPLWFWQANNLIKFTYMCVLFYFCTIRTRKPTLKNYDRTAQSLASTMPHAPSKIPKQKLKAKQIESTLPTPTALDPPKPSLLPKPKVKVVIPPALQQRLKQQQQQQHQQSQPEEPSIPEEEYHQQPEPDSPSAAGGSRIPVRTLKAERRALTLAARQSGLSVEEYLKRLETTQDDKESPASPTTPTGKSRSMIK